MVAPAAKSQRLGIVGGGPSGLASAMFALSSGVKAQDITVYEAAGRFGGKVETAMLGDTPINKATEFIDGDNTRLIETANFLKAKGYDVNLIETQDQGSETFQTPNGRLMKGEEFHKKFEPIKKAMNEIRAEIQADPQGELAQRVNIMSMEGFLKELQERVPKNPDRSIFRKIWDFITFQKNRVDPDIVAMAANAYASEAGRQPDQVSALQFLNESSPELDRFLASDCKYRIEGGTQKLTDAMHDYLAKEGVQFHKSTQVTAVEKQADGSIAIASTHDGQGQRSVVDNVMIAVPAYALSSISGLESLGLSPEALNLVNSTQYTNNMKFTVRINPGAEIPNANFFGKGFQCWSSEPGTMTFLCNGEMLQNMKPREAIEHCLQSYAKSNKIDAKLFDYSAGNIVFNNPGKSPCYASPGPGQMLALEMLAGDLDRLSQNGVGLAGSYIPLRTESGLSFGFMEGGLASAKFASENLLGNGVEKTKWRDMLVSQQQELAVPPGLPTRDGRGAGRFA